MMRLFARRQDSHPASERRIDPARAPDRLERRARRQARPEAEALDSRLLLSSARLHRDDIPPDLSARVAEALKPYFDQGQIPGVSVAVVIDGHVALAQGYGLSNVATGAPVEADTRFDIGSVTKTFTALGVLLLYQESQGTSHPLDLNAPIREYVHNTPSFKLPRKWSGVTTMELLDMTSGIKSVPDSGPWQAKLESVAQAPLQFAPGTKTSYSNTNFDLLGELIEQWTGEKYGTFIQDQILDPLGMSQTQVLGQSASVPNQAVGYDAPKDGRWPKAKVLNGQAMYAASGMVSTAQDMATYMKALLDGRLLDPATYGLMYTSKPTLEYGVTPASNAVRGLGWDSAIDTSAGPTEVTKAGQVPGYISELILHPTSHSGVFVSINTNPQGSRDRNAVTALQVAESVYAAT